MNRQDLIARGYFPRELPPPFKTTTFASFATEEISSQQPKKISKLYSHSNVRYGSLRRKLGIPNPASFLSLATLISSQWDNIQSITQSSRLSKSKPIYTPLPGRTRSISPSLFFSDLPRERARNRAIGRYALQTDISQFYQSIYTHSIPWAIHGKGIAKLQKNNSDLFGNNLDKIVRSSQDGQTMGIPIGPDTSLVVAELILCTLDVEIKRLIDDFCSSPYRGFRYSDDYELIFLKRSEAESALSIIQQVLSDFELSINPDKTRIIELPCALDDSWVLELSNYKFSSKKTVQMQDIVRYFDSAFQVFRKFSKKPVLKYAVARIGNFNDLHRDNWPLLESLLLQVIEVDPGTIRDALSIIRAKQNKNWPIDLDSLEESLNVQIIKHAPLKHSSEVAWIIWAVIVFQLSIHEEAAKEISKTKDSVVAILALDAQEKGRIPTGINTFIWEGLLTKTELYEDQWLFSYEANYKDYLPTAHDYVSEDAWFCKLKQNGVTFYDQDAPLEIPPEEISGPSGEV